MDKVVPRPHSVILRNKGDGDSDSDSAPHSQGLKIHTRHWQGCVWGSAQPWKILLGSRWQSRIQERRAALGPDPGHVLGDTDPS